MRGRIVANGTVTLLMAVAAVWVTVGVAIFWLLPPLRLRSDTALLEVKGTQFLVPQSYKRDLRWEDGSVWRWEDGKVGDFFMEVALPDLAPPGKANKHMFDDFRLHIEISVRTADPSVAEAHRRVTKFWRWRSEEQLPNGWTVRRSRVDPVSGKDFWPREEYYFFTDSNGRGHRMSCKRPKLSKRQKEGDNAEVHGICAAEVDYKKGIRVKFDASYRNLDKLQELEEKVSGLVRSFEDAARARKAGQKHQEGRK